MAKLVFPAGLVALVAVLVLTQNQIHAAPAPAEIRQYTAVGAFPPLPVKDLLLEVDRVGDRTEQIVDNQQGQVVKQTVVPGGIRQTVYRNGQIITDDIIKRPKSTPVAA